MITPSLVLFYAAAALTIGGGLGVVMTRNIVYAAFAQNGLLAYVAGTPASRRARLAWYDVGDGLRTVEDAPIDGYTSPAASPDGERIAVGLSRD